MKALLRKEFRELLRSSLVAGLIGGAGLIATGRYVLDYGPPHPAYDGGGKLWALYCLVAGVAMGYWQISHERARGTEAYLHHRATGAGGAFRAKVLAGLACLGIVLALELGLHAAWFALFSGVADLARWERIGQHLAIASLLVSGYGVGCWSSAMPRKEPTVLFTVLLASASLYLVSAVLSVRWDGAPEPPLARFVLVELALGGLLIGLAGRIHRAARELERPLATRLGLALLPLGVLLLGLPVAKFPGGVQERLHEAALERQPHVVLARDGEIFAAARTPEGFVRVDASGTPLSEPLLEYNGWGYQPQHAYLTVYDPARTPLAWATPEPPAVKRVFPARPFEFDGPWLHLERSIAWGRGLQTAWFHRARGLVLAIASGDEGRASRWLGKGEGGERFSPETVVVYGGYTTTALVDPADPSAWRLTAGPDRALVPAPLPEGERLLGALRVHGLWRVRIGIFEPFGYSDHLVARGERGVFAWSDAGWTPYEPGPGEVLESEVEGAVELRLEIVNQDALMPHLAVFDARSGELLFEYEYAPRTPGEKLALAVVAASTLLRPPIAVLAALGEPPTAFDRHPPRPLDGWILDPALAGGNRPWLAALAFVVAGLFARASWRVFGDDPRDRARRIAWTAATVLLGWPAILALVLLEPRRERAPRPSAAPARAARPDAVWIAAR